MKAVQQGLGGVLREKRYEIRRIAARHGASNVRVFVFAARGEDDADSDLDLLVETGQETSSWFPAGLILDIEALLGRKVEVVTEQALHPALREGVLREARVV